MKVLVTGAKGFVGRNLCLELKNKGYEVLSYDLNNTKEELDLFLKEAEFIFHLAGVNRPKDASEFKKGNQDFTSLILDKLRKFDSKAPIVFTSSIQATRDNDYGKSKKGAEEVLKKYGIETENIVYPLRLANLFGKWSRPNYNSVIATWCFNVARDLDIVINDPETVLELTYIDDLVAVFMSLLQEPNIKKTVRIPTFSVKLGEIARLLNEFKKSRQSLDIKYLNDSFAQKLYATYLSYIPTDKFSYPLVTHSDNRGSFTELIRLGMLGQVSVNIIKPGITKGNHYHHTKNEKFIVVKGEAEIAFRLIGTKEIIRYVVNDKKFEVVDIIPGYTHSIKNIGKDDAVVIMWANETFDPNNPDTVFELVE
ncbi:MAG: NAD-dependent epimerase/dehydratase family protein [Bacilli bacterium]|jgi:UDP-2-acetamido-2,6-beta-L-arabino-hexul-4-ose reductase|nr:NAD-dependent epimerase/dehydratase family protein [Bacilli bacterium]